MNTKDLVITVVSVVGSPAAALGGDVAGGATSETVEVEALMVSETPPTGMITGMLVVSAGFWLAVVGK